MPRCKHSSTCLLALPAVARFGGQVLQSTVASGLGGSRPAVLLSRSSLWGWPPSHLPAPVEYQSLASAAPAVAMGGGPCRFRAMAAFGCAAGWTVGSGASTRRQLPLQPLQSSGATARVLRLNAPGPLARVRHPSARPGRALQHHDPALTLRSPASVSHTCVPQAEAWLARSGLYTAAASCAAVPQWCSSSMRPGQSPAGS